MRMFDVQGIEIEASRRTVFEFVRNPRNLPQWAHAFESADDQTARLTTPAGMVDVRPLIGAIYSLDEAETAFKAAAAKGARKILMSVSK